MTVCILGNGLTALTLAKALVNQNIYVDVFIKKKSKFLNKTEQLVFQKVILNFLIKI
jgi:2-octaprenyl-6-methoxyphenol hydroxylase